MRITVNAVPSGSVSVSSGSSSNVLVEQTQTGTVSALPGDRSPASIVVKNYTVDNVTTSEIEEGVNLYFSNARAIAAFSAGQSITLDANGRINSTATGGGSSYTDSNTYSNVQLLNYITNAALTGYATNNQLSVFATTANLNLKANITDLIVYNDSNVYSNVALLNYITSSALSGYATNSQLSTYATVANLDLKANTSDLVVYNDGNVYSNVQLLNYITDTALDGYATNSQVNSIVSYSNDAVYANVIQIGYTTPSYVDGAIANLINSAPSTLDTLNELANAISNDQAFSATITASLATKAKTTDLTTANVAEVSNLYFTSQRARQAVESAQLQTLNVAGNVHIYENLVVDGNINFTGNVINNTVTGNSGIYLGDASGFGALYAGIAGYTPLPSTVIQATSHANAYTQINYQNLDSGTEASAEYVLTSDDGTDTTNYLDVGISNSGWTGTQENSLGDAVGPNDGWMYVQGGTGGGNLILGTTTTGKQIKIVSGGPGKDNLVAVFNAANTEALSNTTGTLTLNGGIGIRGNVYADYLKGNGSAISGITSLNNGSYTLTVNSDGKVNITGNIFNTGTNPTTLWSNDSITNYWRSPTGGGPGQPLNSLIRVNSSGATITLDTGVLGFGSSRSWLYDHSGNITFPDSTVQTTAFNNTAVYSNVITLGYITSSALSGYTTNAQLSSYATTANLALKANVVDLKTANIAELTNLYFTNARARLAISVSGAGSYNNTTGVITINETSSTYGDANTYSNIALLGHATNAQLSGYATTTNLALKANVVDLTTANVAEVTSLYFTNARVYSNVISLGYITSSSLSGYATNAQLATYATNAQLASYATVTDVALKANIVDLTTANVTELTNLYFTNARVYSNVTSLGYITSSSLSGYATNSQLASYATNAQLASYATNTQLTSYATVANLALKANIVDLTTSNVSELTNLYYTNARARLAISVSGAGSYDNSTGVITINETSATYSDSNVYSNVTLLGYATNANVALKANVVDLTTANVTESTNLYFTNARSYANVVSLGYITSSALTGYATNTQLASYATNSQLATYATNAQLASYATNAQLTSYATTTNVALKANVVDLTTANVTEVTNLYFTNARSYANVITLGYAKTANLTTANVTEVTNQYFTNARAIAAVTASSISVAGGVTANAATAFTAGTAAISGVALSIPYEGGIRNSYNGLNNMYFDVSTGGTTHGQFQFRSGSSFTNILTMSPTAFNVSTDATVTARSPSLARTAFNSAIDTELTVDELRFRISNQGGIFPQVISNMSGSKNLGWTGIGAISGYAVTQLGSTGTIVANNAWTTLFNGHGMDNAADTVTVTLQDKVLGRIYRITFMRSDNGSTTGYNIIAERIL